MPCEIDTLGNLETQFRRIVLTRNTKNLTCFSLDAYRNEPTTAHEKPSLVHEGLLTSSIENLGALKEAHQSAKESRPECAKLHIRSDCPFLHRSELFAPEPENPFSQRS